MVRGPRPESLTLSPRRWSYKPHFCTPSLVKPIPNENAEVVNERFGRRAPTDRTENMRFFPSRKVLCKLLCKRERRGERGRETKMERKIEREGERKIERDRKREGGRERRRVGGRERDRKREK